MSKSNKQTGINNDSANFGGEHGVSGQNLKIGLSRDGRSLILACFTGVLRQLTKCDRKFVTLDLHTQQVVNNEGVTSLSEIIPLIKESNK